MRRRVLAFYNQDRAVAGGAGGGVGWLFGCLHAPDAEPKRSWPLGRLARRVLWMLGHRGRYSLAAWTPPARLIVSTGGRGSNARSGRKGAVPSPTHLGAM